MLATAVVAVLALVAAGIFGVALVRRSWPQTSGEIALDGLDGRVSVLRDGLGVPQLYADSPRDLFRGQGFVTAQDRFFQMDYRRHVASGRLAELVGAAGVANDSVIRTLGWRAVAEAELPLLAPATRQYLTAYAEGVNDYLARAGGAVSLEYAVLDRSLPEQRIDPWTEVDSLVWFKAMAWDWRSFGSELTRARLGAVLDPTLVSALYPAYPSAARRSILGPSDWAPGRPGLGAGGPTPLLTPADGLGRGASVLERTQRGLDAAVDLLGGGAGLGSNSWVIGPARSASGAPILANDPHLAIGIPDPWYQIGLHCRSVSAACPFQVSGFATAGMPGIVIGHNTTVAWGQTALAADVADFYLERITDQSALRDGQQVPLAQRTETIAVRGGDPVALTVRRAGTRPIVSDVLDAAAAVGRRPIVGGVVQQESLAVSIAWTGLTPAPSADSIFALNAAADAGAARAAVKNAAVPAYSLVYADAQGRIGYQAVGAIPLRRSSTPGAPPGYLPAPGWDSQFDWQGLVPFDDLPWTLDPKAGVIVAANQQVSASVTPFLGTDWDYGWRSERIHQLIGGSGKLTVADLQGAQADLIAESTRPIVAALQAIDLTADPYTQQAQELLRGWDGSHPVQEGRASAAAAYFNAVWLRLLANTFDDQLPNDVRADGSSRWRMALINLLADPSGGWWDDKRTPSVVESRDEILTRSLVQARLDLTKALGSAVEAWSWGKLHTATFTHPVLGDPNAPGLLRWQANRGPVAMPGEGTTINANGWDATKGFAVESAPSMRMVVDLGSLDASTWSTQTGASGHVGHPHYADQLGVWATGGGFAWPFSGDAVNAAKAEELTLVPKG